MTEGRGLAEGEGGGYGAEGGRGGAEEGVIGEEMGHVGVAGVCVVWHALVVTCLARRWLCEREAGRRRVAVGRKAVRVGRRMGAAQGVRAAQHGVGDCPVVGWARPH